MGRFNRLLMAQHPSGDVSMDYEVFEDRLSATTWRVEAIGADGRSRSEQRAREYAQHRATLERKGSR
jgi:hypothetical protein